MGERLTRGKRVLLALCGIGFVLMAVICITVVVVDDNIAHMTPSPYLSAVPNVFLAAFVLLVGAIAYGATRLWGVRRDPARTSAKHFGRANDSLERQTTWYARASVVLPVLLLLYQVFAYYVAGINTGWDVSVLTDVALYPKGDFGSIGWYFSSYPNNRFLLWFFRVLEFVRQHVVPAIGPKSFFAYSACVASSLSFALFMRVARTLMPSDRSAMAASILYGALVGLSPWFMIPYSDTYGLLFCTLLLWCVACAKNPISKWLLFSVCAAIGCAIKPTVIFAFAAVLICSAFANAPWKGRAKQAAIAIVLVCVGFGTGWCATRLAANDVAGSLGEDGAFGVWHYVMMGLNDETDGVYLESDVLFSRGFATQEERAEGNRRVVTERLQAYGVRGLLFHELKKLLIDFNDGTFGWVGEGYFYKETRSGPGLASELVSNLYYADKPGYVVFRTTQQLLWIAVLMGIPAGILGIRHLRTNDDTHELVMIATMLACIVALALFVLVFEARARYLYLYGGFFVLLSAWGYAQVCGRLLHRADYG